MFAPYVLVQTGIEDVWWIIWAGKVSTEAVVFPALCLPLSAIDSSHGLMRQDGRLLIMAVLILGMLGPRALENVGTLQSHRHFPAVAAVIAWVKYKIVMSHVCDPADHLPRYPFSSELSLV